MIDVKAELLPCPFCGGTAHQWGNAANDGSGAVECGSCKTAIHRKKLTEAIAAWNTRPQPSPKVDGLVEMRDLLCAGSVAMSPHERVRWIDRVRKYLDETDDLAPVQP